MIFLFVFLFTSSAGAADNPTISRQKLLETFRAQVPTAFCGEKGYFRSCFAVTEEQCLATTKTALAACITKIEKDIPAVLHQPNDGRAWGEKVGACAGDKVETDLGKPKKANPDCNDAAKWK